MSTLEQHLEGFSQLGHYLREIDESSREYTPLFECLRKAEHSNGWFTKDNCLSALNAWGESLTKKALNQWVERYFFGETSPKTIGLILAGNIPLVGFHDVLCVLMSGHNGSIKLSSADPYLIPFLYDLLNGYSPVFNDRLHFTQERLTHFDAVIATGSNNAARYFEHYFGHVPHIIRKNRNGIAVLSGEESKEELAGLARDIVQYYGLGCRSIAQVYVPKNYDLNNIFGALYPHAALMESAKYANNYDYNKAVYLMSEFELLDNGFMLLREDSAYGSPVASLHYSYYDSLASLKKELEERKEEIQCISTQLPFEGSVPLGKAQQPALWDYADGVDPIQFLLRL
ncbi:MAG: acyl-CoA reductase [Flavobacteriaceae bacterium]